MLVDILVDGRVVGVATITVVFPEELARRHGVTAPDVLRASITGRPQEWYQEGNVTLQRYTKRAARQDETSAA